MDNKEQSRIERGLKFIEEAKKRHEGENIDYSKVEYINNRTPVCLIDHDLRPDGTEYGEYWQTPDKHLQGHSHPDKRWAKKWKDKKITTEQYIERARKAHDGEDLDYSETVYRGMHSNIVVIDHDKRPDGTEYGRYAVNAQAHLNGTMHPDKAKLIGAAKRRETLKEKYSLKDDNLVVKDFRTRKYVNSDDEEYVVVDEKNPDALFRDLDNKAGALTSYIRKQYGAEVPSMYKRNKYYQQTGDYWWEQWLTYKKTQKKKTVKCPYCGWKTTDLKNRSGAFGVHLRKQHNMDECAFVKEHPEFYDYFSMANGRFQLKMETDTSKFVVCKECGMKLKRVDWRHLQKYHNMTTGEYIEKHGANDMVAVDCSEKESRAAHERNKIYGWGDFTSKAETEISDYIRSLGLECEKNRSLTDYYYEIDVYVPSKRFGIEHNGLFWHCERYKSPTEHLEKTEAVRKSGATLIQVFEDEWERKPDIVKAYIRGFLIDCADVDFACGIINKEQGDMFLDANHVEGKCPSDVYIGAFFDETLVGVLAINKPKRDDGWFIGRYAVSPDIPRSKCFDAMFRYFISEYNPLVVSVKADIRWDEDNFYKNKGFTVTTRKAPRRFYLHLRQRWLKAPKEDLHYIHDCGYAIMKWRKDSN